MIRTIVGALILIASQTAFAGYSSSYNTRGVSVTVEPIIGYERVQKLVPTPHTKDRLFYGARAMAGVPKLSLEAEYTRGRDSESFPLQNTSITDTDDRIKLGLRSSANLVSILSAYGRAGGQASRKTQEKTEAGVSSKTVGTWKYYPYAGAGLSARLGNNFSLDGGVTVVFADWPQFENNEYQTSLGFSVHLP